MLLLLVVMVMVVRRRLCVAQIDFGVATEDERRRCDGGARRGRRCDGNGGGWTAMTAVAERRRRDGNGVDFWLLLVERLRLVVVELFAAGGWMRDERICRIVGESGGG